MPNILNNLSVTGSLTTGGTALFLGNYISASGSLVVGNDANISRNLNITGSGTVSGSFVITGSLSSNTFTTGSLFSSGCATIANSMLISGSLTISGSIGGRNLSGTNTGDQTITSLSAVGKSGSFIDGHIAIFSGSSGSIIIDSGISASGIYSYNYLINGGFDFVQRQTPGTLTTIATDKYSADRWRVSVQNASVQYQRADATTTTTMTSMFKGRYKQITNTGRYMIYQIIETENSVPLRGKEVTFSIKMQVSAAKSFRMGIIENTSSGSSDVIPSTFITNWNADGSDPTLGANLAYVGASTLFSISAVAPTMYSITATLPTTSLNFVVAVWADTAVSVNDTFILGEAGLYKGDIIPKWSPKLIQQEFALCQRYYQKSYNKDIAPSTASQAGGIVRMRTVNPTAQFSYYGNIRFPISMRTSPTVVNYGYAGGSSVISSVAGVDQGSNSGLPGDIGENSFSVFNGNASSYAATEAIVHFTSESEL